MKTKILMAALAALVVLSSSSPAFARGGDVLKELVPPPRMLLKHQEELKLSEAQKKELKQIIKDAQEKALDLEFKVEEETAKLAKMLDGLDIDLKKALAQADQVLKVENQLKKVRLEMLIRTKMVLNKEQLAKIETFLEQRRERRRRPE